MVIKSSKNRIKTKKLREKKIKNKTFKMIKLKCSPLTKKNKFTCLEKNTLLKLKELWNKKHPDDSIKTNDTHKIWIFLQHRLSNVCNKESCWLKQEFVKGKLNYNNEINFSFAPKSPDNWKKNPNQWLSSIDILNVMKQYEHAYKCFEFIGPSPIDFDSIEMYGKCVWEELCHFNLQKQIKNGKTKIGIIFNTDPHNKGGEHWISLFINIKKGKIFFFDSAGAHIPVEIMTFVNRVMKQGKELKSKPINFHFDQNYPVEHQYGGTECGVYSIYFIVHMLEDKITSHYLKTHILKDEYIEKFRKIYFNSEL